MDKLETCFKDVKATGYVAMTAYADPSSDEVGIYGEENEDNDELRAVGEGVGDGDDVAHEEAYPSHNVGIYGEENEDDHELRAAGEGVGDGVGIYGEENEDDHELRALGEGAGDGDDVAHEEAYPSHNVEPGPSNNNPKKRKRRRKAQKQVGKADKRQYSLNRMIDGLKSVSKAKSRVMDDVCNVDSCLTLLDSVPGLEKGSTLYFIACRVLTKAVNRQTFMYLMQDDPKLAFGWLNTFTIEDLKYLTG